MGPSEQGPYETRRIYTQAAGPATGGWLREAEGDTEFPRHRQPCLGPDHTHFATFHLISPNDFSRKAVTYYLTLLKKKTTGKISARRVQNSTLKGGLCFTESVFWPIYVCRRPREGQTLCGNKVAWHLET